MNIPNKLYAFWLLNAVAVWEIAFLISREMWLLSFLTAYCIGSCIMKFVAELVGMLEQLEIE